MNYQEILKKVVDGGALSEEERTFLRENALATPDGGGNAEGRIPKSRLDEVLSKQKAEKERADALADELAELKEKFEALENAGKTDAEKAQAAHEKELTKLQKQLSDLTRERDEARASFAKSERAAKIAHLASKHHFSDASYLDYLTASRSVDLDDESAVGDFMRDLGKTSPHLFQSTAKPGGGTGAGQKAASDAQTRIDELLKKPELSSRESAEVIKLQQTLSAERAAAAPGSNPGATKGE